MPDDDRIHVLMAGPQLPALAAPVEREFIVHRLWLAADRDAFLAEHGAQVRAVVTNAAVGASAALIDALPRLEIIASSGVGLDAIDLDAARRRGVIVTNTPGVLDDCVADTALALLLALVRRICVADRFVRAGRWTAERFPLATSLGGKTCGIVGLGNIGRAIARRAEGFGMRIAYCNRHRRGDVDYDWFATPAELARASDFLVLALPGGAATRHAIGADVLDALGPAGYLVNIARGSVVDEAALVAALRDGRIAGAGLDVFEDEPHAPPELFALDNVVLTPHIASATHETRNAMSGLTFANLQAHFAGRAPLTPVP